MKTLYLIRHAQSHANAGGAPLPDCELPLSDIGRRQAAVPAKPPRPIAGTTASSPLSCPV